MDIILIVPVHNGGEKFRQCLESLSTHIGLFGQVVISLNSGVKNHFDEKIMNEVIKPGKRDRVLLLKHTEILAAPRHLHTIVTSSALRNTDARQPVMLLFHDDMLLGPNLQSFLEKKNLDLSRSVVLGPWLKRFEKSGSNDEFIDSMGGVVKSPGKFLHQTSISAPFTNASGMIAPYASVQDFSKSFYNSRHGARMEYSLIASSHTENVLAADVPLVSLLDHPGQLGKQLSYADYQRDEIRFQLFMLKSGRIVSPRLVLLFVIRIGWGCTVILLEAPFRYVRKSS